MTKQKTISKSTKEWFESVKDEKLRAELLGNLVVHIESSNDHSLSMAIQGGFMWDDSPEGGKYWRDVIKMADDNKIEMI